MDKVFIVWRTKPQLPTYLKDKPVRIEQIFKTHEEAETWIELNKDDIDEQFGLVIQQWIIDTL